MTAGAIVLAGGASRRLGQDKRRLRLWGEAGPTVLERTVALVAAICPEVVVVLNDPAAWPGLRARVVSDRLAGAGPLAGLEAGLDVLGAERALVVAADMPFLSPPLLGAMLARAGDLDALVLRTGAAGPRNPLGVEPLHAVYRRSCLAPIRGVLARGERQVTAFLPHVRWAAVEPDEWRAYDPAGRSAFSINTEAELAAARRLREDERGILRGLDG